jgi:hypothetical protein
MLPQNENFDTLYGSHPSRALLRFLGDDSGGDGGLSWD